MLKVKFAKITGIGTIPTKSNESDAGYDFYSTEDVVIKAGQSAIIKTDICWCPINKHKAFNCYMQMKSRSGMAFKHGIECTNAGVIDEDYRGEIAVKLYNTNGFKFFAKNNNDVLIKKGDRIAQGIIHTIPKVKSIEVPYSNIDLETERGTNGFGSSGK